MPSINECAGMKLLAVRPNSTVTYLTAWFLLSIEGSIHFDVRFLFRFSTLVRPCLHIFGGGWGGGGWVGGGGTHIQVGSQYQEG
jgi:hypothetical protein